MLISLVGNLMLSLARTIFYLVAKRPTAALDESAAVLGVVGHPLKLSNARRRRARGRRAAYSRLRARPAARAGRSGGWPSSSPSVAVPAGAEDLAGAHHASDDPTDDDSLLTDSGFLQRLLTRPGVLLVLALIVIAAVAERSRGDQRHAGRRGAAARLGRRVRAMVAVPARLPSDRDRLGQRRPAVRRIPGAARDACCSARPGWLSTCCCSAACRWPALTAFLAVRRVTKSVAIRIWAAASYALLPIAFGAISAGRLGSAVAFVLIPLIGLLAGRMFSQPPKLARRAAWATGLAVTVGAAFVPLLWPMAVAGAVVAGLGLRRPGTDAGAEPRHRRADAARAPAAHGCSRCLSTPPGCSSKPASSSRAWRRRACPARSLLLLSPGGPGLPPYWVSAALLLAGLAALLASRRRPLIVAGWLVAVARSRRRRCSPAE